MKTNNFADLIQTSPILMPREKITEKEGHLKDLKKEIEGKCIFPAKDEFFLPKPGSQLDVINLVKTSEKALKISFAFQQRNYIYTYKGDEVYVFDNPLRFLKKSDYELIITLKHEIDNLYKELANLRFKLGE